MWTRDGPGHEPSAPFRFVLMESYDGVLHKGLEPSQERFDKPLSPFTLSLWIDSSAFDALPSTRPVPVAFLSTPSRPGAIFNLISHPKMPSTKIQTETKEQASYTHTSHTKRSKSRAGEEHSHRSSTPDVHPPLRRSNSTHASRSSSRSPEPPLPTTAFSVMQEWEIESLDKWQRRLENAKRDQKILRTRLDSLRRDEEQMWADRVSYSRRARSSSSASSSSDSDYPDPHGRSKKHTKAASVNDYDEWVQLLYAEIASVQEQIAQHKDAEVRARKGIEKSTERLERLRALGGRWASPSQSPSPSPPQSRAASPGPAPRSTSPPRRSAASPAPSRRPSVSESSRPNTPATKPRSNSTGSIRPSFAKPLKPTTTKAGLDPWLSYEDRWHQLLTNSNEAGITLRFTSIPWPMETQPTSVDDIKAAEIRAFLLSSRAMRPPVKLSGTEPQEKLSPVNDLKTRQAVLRTALLRWHPDKVLPKFLSWVEEDERAAVKDGVGRVIRCEYLGALNPRFTLTSESGLNEIMRQEEVRSKTL